jgi:ferrous iron transport protein B
MKSVLLTAWDSAKSFLRKAGTIILAASVVLWFLLNLPLRTAEVAGMDQTAAASYVVDNSYAAGLGKIIEPLFAPLGFDWRICVGLIGAMAAREVFVATMGQVFAVNGTEDLAAAMHSAQVTSGPHHGALLFTAPTIVALLVFFVYALLCMATVATIRRETNSWKWPTVAWGYLLALAWVAAFAARHITLWLTG